MKFEDLKIGDEIVNAYGEGVLNIPHRSILTVILLHYSSEGDNRLIGIEAMEKNRSQSVMIPTAMQAGFSLLKEEARQTTASLHKLISDCQFKDWNIVLRFDDLRPYVQIQFKDKDNFGTEEEMQYGRKWMLSYHMCDTEVVRTVKKAIDAAMQHEVDESFKYKGRTIFNPHRSVEALWQAAGAENGVDLRK